MGKWIKKILTKWGLNILTKKVDKMASKSKGKNTTIAGIAGIITLLASAAKAWFDGDPSTVVDFGILIPALIMAIGLLFSKDANATHSGNPT